MIKKRSLTRLSVRLGFLTLAVLLLSPLPLWFDTQGLMVQASSFVTLCVILAGSGLSAGSIPGIGFSIAALLRKRWFCINVCPTGLILDGVSFAGIKNKSSWWIRCPSLGKYAALMTIAGSVIGYPLFLWLDPLAFFNSAVSVYTAQNIISAILSVSGFMLLILTAITSGNLWCSRICPLGGTQDILFNIGTFIRNSGKKLKSGLNDGQYAKSGFPWTRRTFLAVASGIGLGLCAKGIGLARLKNPPLRPPGAIKEESFTGQCLRCGNCISACPSGIIHPDTGHAGILGIMAPVVRYENEYCREKCNACTNVCPSGAIKHLNVKEKHEYIIGEAILNTQLCYLVRGINDCNICERCCPFDAIQIYWDDEEYVAFPFVDTLKCNGCGACEFYCPTGMIKAIKVWKKAI